jgi:hypothetical protein
MQMKTLEILLKKEFCKSALGSSLAFDEYKVTAFFKSFFWAGHW